MSGILGIFSSTILEATLLILFCGEILLFGLVIFFLIRQHQLQARLAVFFQGKDAKTLESVLHDQLKGVQELDQEIQELFEISNRLRELCLKSLHKTHVVRFNPFKEVGGNQSFSVVLLDGKNSGVVLSSLHTREGTRVYAKPVQGGAADGFPFTEEEKSAIAQAISGKSTLI